MIRQIENLACLFAVALVAVACNKPADTPAPTPSLKDVFADDFLIGTALNTGQIEEKDSVANSMIQTQFNAITAENIMKSEEIHQEWSTYDFDLAISSLPMARKMTCTLWAIPSFGTVNSPNMCAS